MLFVSLLVDGWEGGATLLSLSAHSRHTQAGACTQSMCMQVHALDGGASKWQAAMRPWHGRGGRRRSQAGRHAAQPASYRRVIQSGHGRGTRARRRAFGKPAFLQVASHPANNSSCNACSSGAVPQRDEKQGSRPRCRPAVRGFPAVSWVLVHLLRPYLVPRGQLPLTRGPSPKKDTAARYLVGNL